MNIYIIALVVYAAGLLPALLLERRFNKELSKDPGWPELPPITAWFLSWLTFFATLIVFITAPSKENSRQ
jgi:hypothetical protein